MFRPELSGFRTIPKARWVVVSPPPPANSLTHRPALPTSPLVLSTHHPIAPYRGQKSSWDYQPARYSQLKMATATMLRTAAIMSFLAATRVDAADTASPNKVIAKPKCDSSATVSIRYSPSSERLYLESADGKTRGGCVTLTQIWENMDGRAPLYPVKSGSGDVSNTATGTWLLTESLWVEDGITLQVGDI